MEIIKMKNNRMALATALVCLGLATAACSGETPAEQAPSSSNSTEAAPASGAPQSGSVATVATGAPAPSSVPAAEPEPPLSYPALPKGAPKDFPVPSGAKVSAVGADGSFSVTGEGAEKVLAFYRKALPDAGYKITSDEPTAVGFEGAAGKGKVAVDGDHVTVTISK
ncbi:hypothetical protein [Actinokineospora alba]|nr:hypothetical protein [Actinokineospora alba]